MPDNELMDLSSLRLHESRLWHHVQCQMLYGSVSPDASHPDKIPSVLVWEALECELSIDLSQSRMAIKPGLILWEIHCTCNELGEQRMLIPLHIGKGPGDAELLARTTARAGGEPRLVEAWGEIAQRVLWPQLQACLRSLWIQRQGDKHQELLGLYCDGLDVVGLFGLPQSEESISEMRKELGGIRHRFEPKVLSLGLQQIRSGHWKGGDLIPSAVAKRGRSIASVRFQDGIEINTDEVVSLMKTGKVDVAGVTAVRAKNGKSHLRSKPDARLDNKLTKLPKIVRF